MDDEQTTNQPDLPNDGGVDTAGSDYQTEPNDADFDAQPDDDGQATQAADDDSEEIEHEGSKYRVPKALREAFMKNADYTQKTQHLAEVRKEAESARDRYINASNEYVSAKAQEIAIDAQINQFEQIDWNKFFDNDPVQAQKLAFQYQQLKDLKAQAAEKTRQIESQRTLEQQQVTAKQYEQSLAVLKRDIPDWSPDLANKVTNFAVKELGFDAAELRGIVDPRIIKGLHAAMIGSQLIKQASQKSNKQNVVDIKPVPKVGGTNSPARKSMEDMETNDWMKARNEQLRKSRGR